MLARPKVGRNPLPASSAFMPLNMANKYDAYAYFTLVFVCDDCRVAIAPKEPFTDCDDDYCYDLARKAESRGWFVGVNGNGPCLCPDCRKKRDIPNDGTSFSA